MITCMFTTWWISWNRFLPQIIICILVSVIYDEEFFTKDEKSGDTDDLSDNIVHHACTYPLHVIGLSFSLLLPVITVNIIVIIKTRMLPMVFLESKMAGLVLSVNIILLIGFIPSGLNKDHLVSNSWYVRPCFYQNSMQGLS